MGSEHAAEFGMRSTEADFEFAPAGESLRKLRRAMAEPKIAVTEPMLKPPLRRRAVCPAQAAASLECGALSEPRTTT